MKLADDGVWDLEDDDFVKVDVEMNGKFWRLAVMKTALPTMDWQGRMTQAIEQLQGTPHE